MGKASRQVSKAGQELTAGQTGGGKGAGFETSAGRALDAVLWEVPRANTEPEKGKRGADPGSRSQWDS